MSIRFSIARMAVSCIVLVLFGCGGGGGNDGGGTVAPTATLSDPVSGTTVIAMSNSMPLEDIVIDFGGIGLWARMNDASWLKLNNNSPNQLVVGDMDGNGADDVIAYFSSFGGIFVKRNLGGWSQLSTLTPDDMTIGDLDGNGQDDVVVDFGGIGLWARMNDSSWLKFNNASPTQIEVADMDGNGQDDVVAVYGTGIFVKRNLGGWTQLHNFVPEAMAVGDLDNNGKDDLVVDFGGIGLWARMNDASWLKLHNSSPELIATGDVDGNGADDVLATFTGLGLWQKLNLAGWSKLSNSAPDQVVTGDVNGSGKDDIIADFGSTLGGIFVKRDQGAWVKLHNTSPDSMAVGNLDGSGGGDGNHSGGTVAPTATVSGSLSGTTVIAINTADEIVASDDTTGKTADINGNFPFTLAGLPLDEDIRIYLISGGAIYPMFFDSDANGSYDTNVFSLTAETTIDLGFVDLSFPDENGKAIPEYEPAANVNVVSGTADLVIPTSVNEPPTSGLTLSQLVKKGMNALGDGWVLGARTYFEAAVNLAGSSASNDADTARFLFALTRFLSLGFDTLSDGNSADMNRVGDILDRLSVPNNEVRANWELISTPDVLPADSPTGNEYRDFLYEVAAPEIAGSVSNLDEISTSFNKVWTNPVDNTQVESDYGDVLVLRGTFKSLLASIATQRAYDLDVDVDQIKNSNTTVQEFLAGNITFLSLVDKARLAEAKSYLTSGAIIDFKDAIDVINGEVDDQTDDFVTLDLLGDPTGATAKAKLDQLMDSLVNGETVVGSATINLKHFFDDGVDFRSPSDLLPPFAANSVAGPFPDPTFDGVIVSPDLNEDINPADGVPDILQ